MGDMAEVFRAMKKADQERRRKRVIYANPEGWRQHTQWHWSTTLLGDHLDYWPSKCKWLWRGQIYYGNDKSVRRFILNREGE
jgi:hypothetical protein